MQKPDSCRLIIGGNKALSNPTWNAMAFKSLCREKKSRSRIQYTLKKGKTLRN